MSSKFKFKIQQYQTDAVNSVCEVFEGQQKHDAISFMRDKGRRAQKSMEEDSAEYNLGFKNPTLNIDDDTILQNIQAVQSKYGVFSQSEKLAKKHGAINLGLEMETGTGKTYVYIKTMFELNKRYGFSKFIVIVPSVAIREGVKKSFEQMQDHFMETYQKKANYFVYDSDNLQLIDDFSSSNNIQVMIINHQAFNTQKNDRLINQKTERFADRRPSDVISATNPILILDEPQKLAGKKTRESFGIFKPLFFINYSATHKKDDEPCFVYRLNALDAYNSYLVKKIEVKGFDIQNLSGTNGYMYLYSIVLDDKAPPKAKILFEQKQKSGDIKRITKTLEKGDDLYTLSEKMEQYKGYVISSIEVDANNNNYGFVEFTNGIKINLNQCFGNKEEETLLRRIQIRETIISHFDKEKSLFKKNIKCLSLFFIDKVDKYKTYDANNVEQKGEYQKIFEEEYNSELNSRLTIDTVDKYQIYLRDKCSDATKVHNGYFSIDKKSKKIVDSSEKNNSESNDVSAYDLILKNKERLLSFGEETRFIFSHSALSEGWDNPNVFQICTLKESDSDIKKRQEVGRGLRICRNSNYDLIDLDFCKSQTKFHAINKLTVIATESYDKFVKTFQGEFDDIVAEMPYKVSTSFLEHKKLYIDLEDTDNVVIIDSTMAGLIKEYLQENEYIDTNEIITKKYKIDTEKCALVEFDNPHLKACSAAIHSVLQSSYDTNIKFITPTQSIKCPDIKPNANFDKKEFQELWNAINHKYVYQVSFDSTELIKNAINALESGLNIKQQLYTTNRGEQKDSIDKNTIKARDSFVTKKSKTSTIKTAPSYIKYDLIGIIARECNLKRKTIFDILKGLSPQKIAMFSYNPEGFISEFSRIVKGQKGATLVDHIEYNQTNESYSNDIFVIKNKSVAEVKAALSSQKHIFDKVFVDSNIETEFAKAIDTADEVCVFAKLPRDFVVPTPIGNYNPDWAIAFDKDKTKNIYFIAETKGNLDTLELRPIEKAKIECAKKLFSSLSTASIKYNAVTTYKDLINLIK